jgi:hypothetical protein
MGEVQAEEWGERENAATDEERDDCGAGKHQAAPRDMRRDAQGFCAQ